MREHVWAGVVAGVQNFGVSFMADPLISVTLTDTSGAVMGKNLPGSPESRAFFRSIFVDPAVTAGVWELKIENTGKIEPEIVLTTWQDGVR